MSDPRISVLLPVYNAEAYLAEAVESVLAQTFTDFELLAVNDGSTDGSQDLLEGFAARDPRVKVVSRPNTGITGALNEMIALARGTYLARMDADDLSVSTRFERQAAYLDANPGCAIVGSRVMLMDPYGSPVAETGHALTHEEIDADLLVKTGWAIVHPAAMMRADAVRKVGGYDKRWKHCEDHDLFLRLAEVGQLANLPDVLLWYRRHYASINYKKSAEQAAQKEALLREAHQRRGLTFPADWTPHQWTPPGEPEQRRQWGWAALKAGNPKVARKHAARAVRLAPLSAASWRLMYCAARGR